MKLNLRDESFKSFIETIYITWSIKNRLKSNKEIHDFKIMKDFTDHVWETFKLTFNPIAEEIEDDKKDWEKNVLTASRKVFNERFKNPLGNYVITGSTSSEHEVW